MANGNIEIKYELRPCIVHDSKEEKRKALFHCWNQRSQLVVESYSRGGHPLGQASQTFGIVEYEDGAIHEVYPTQIRFVDNAVRECAFPGMEEK